MKGIVVRYNLENENWSDEEYESQEDRFIMIPEWYLRDYIKENTKLTNGESVDRITDVKLKEIK